MRITTAGVAYYNNTFLVALRKPGSSIGESWEFPGGKNREGETPWETLKREYREELGIDIIVKDKLFTTHFQNRSKQYELQAYLIQLKDDTFQLHEHQKVLWLSIDEILNLPLAESDKALAEYLKNDFIKVK